MPHRGDAIGNRAKGGAILGQIVRKVKNEVQQCEFRLVDFHPWFIIGGIDTTLYPMKPDPNLSEQEQIALYNAEIRSTLWQVAALVVLILAALLKGYTLHVEEAMADAQGQIATAQSLLSSCQAGGLAGTGATQPAAGCGDRVEDLQAANYRLAGIKDNGFNAIALAIFGAALPQK